MKKKIIINDFIINESVCNLSCKYCLSNDMSNKKKEKINAVSGVLSKEMNVVDRATNVLDVYETYIDADVLQLSGGEIFLNDGILNLVMKKSNRYKYIYILTNGCVIDDYTIDTLSSVGNVVIGLSLDGHTLDMNQYRFKEKKILDVIMSNISKMHKKQIPIIVNSVIHDMNVNGYHDFLKFLADGFPNVGVFPIAMRGESAERFKPSTDDLRILMDIANDCGLYGRLRMIPTYFEELYKVLTGMTYTNRCAIPYLATELLDSGILFPCPLFWIGELGNVLSDAPTAVFDKVGKHKVYSVLTRRSGSIPFCRNCFSSYSLFNLYATGVIKEDDLRVVPFLDYEHVGAHIQDILHL